MVKEVSWDPALFQFVASPEEPVPHELAEALLDAIERLPELQQQIINAMFYQRASKTQTIQDLGISRGKFERQFVKAMNALREDGLIFTGYRDSR